MIRVAVVEDEIEIGKHIEEIAKECFRELNYENEVKYYQFPRELLWDMQEKDYYDIFLLDIEMSINGMEVAKQIRDMYLEPYIVFVTSYVKYSVKGYEYGAYRYIIKEELEEKLPSAIKAMSRELQSKISSQYIIMSGAKVEKVDRQDIYLMYVDGKYTYFRTRRGTSRVRKPLRTVYEELGRKEFVYVDKGHIVNLQHVMALENGILELRNGEKMQVSAPQLKKVKLAIIEYWRKGS